MSTNATSSAHTPGPWVYDPQHGFVFDAAVKLGVATVADYGCPNETLANARLIAAAPDGYQLAVTMRNACEERFIELTEEMVAGRPGASDEELDDLQAQINNWRMLLNRCEAYLTKVHGKAA